MIENVGGSSEPGTLVSAVVAVVRYIVHRWRSRLAVWIVPSSVVLLHRDSYDAWFATVEEMYHYCDAGGFGHHARPLVRQWLNRLLTSVSWQGRVVQ